MVMPHVETMSTLGSVVRFGGNRRLALTVQKLRNLPPSNEAPYIVPRAVEPRSSVRDRLRHEHVDSKLGGIDRFTTVADVIDHFLGESEPSAAAIKSEP